jgi:maltooligosyltrehalose trehalohydrolase
VVLDLAGRGVAMSRGRGGWWRADVPDAGPGSEYGFRVDGSDPLPDPRSASQPDGPHGLSRLVDHDAFPWTDGGWRGLHLPSAVLYELHVGTFSPEGTFDGVIAHLDHLVDLGVTAVELLPVAEFAGSRGWGTTASTSTPPLRLRRPGRPQAPRRRLPPPRHRRDPRRRLQPPRPEGNYLGRFGPYFTSFYETPWGQAVNYDQPDSDEVRRFAIDNALMWLRDYRIDGLRLDAVHAIVDTSAVHLLEQLARRSRSSRRASAGRSRSSPSPTSTTPRLIRPREAAGYGLTAQWSDDFHHTLHTTLTGEVDGYYEDYGELDQVATVLSEGWLFSGRWSDHRRRTHGRPLAGLPGWRLLGYLQNHDQVGNRAVGDRISATVSPGRCKVGAALYLLGPFVPMVFQGRSGARPRRSSTSPPTPTPSSAGRSPPVGGRSSGPSAGGRRRSPTRRTRPPSSAARSTGTRSASPATPSCWRGTPPASPSAAAGPRSGTAASTGSVPPPTRGRARSSSSVAPSPCS